MTGLGETCSHVASLLWAIEAGIQIRNSMTVTQKKSYWVLPTSIKEVPYAPIREIKFQDKSSAFKAEMFLVDSLLHLYHMYRLHQQCHLVITTFSIKMHLHPLL